MGLVAFFLAACGLGNAPELQSDDDGRAFDTDVSDLGTAEQALSAFDAGMVISDDEFSDSSLMSAAAITSFLSSTPYGTRSSLLDLPLSAPVGSVIASVSQKYRLNPLVLLTKLQAEMSLVSATRIPAQWRINTAMGCGCPDGAACAAAQFGLERQLLCAAQTLRAAYDDAERLGITYGGVLWNKPYRTLDPETIVARNFATTSFYNYTPWVSRGAGGSWMVWNVFRKYAAYIGYVPRRGAQVSPGAPRVVSLVPKILLRASISPRITAQRVHLVIFRDSMQSVAGGAPVRLPVAVLTQEVGANARDVYFNLAARSDIAGTRHTFLVTDNWFQASPRSAITDYTF